MSKTLRAQTSALSHSTKRRIGRACVVSMDAAILTDDLTVENAIYAVQVHLAGTAIDCLEFYEEVGSVPQLFEFLLSALDEYTFSVLQDAILHSFPDKPDGFESTLACRLLNHFSVGLFSVPCELFPSVSSSLPDHMRALQLSLPLLKAIPSYKFHDDPTKEDELTSPIAKRTSQRMRKQAARALRSPVIDESPFKNYNVAPPSTKSDADDLAARVLQELKSILVYYLSVFRMPTLATFFRNAYISSHVAPVVGSRSLSAQETGVLSARTDEAQSPVNLSATGAFPYVQPMKAALYFDSAKGFGQWRILISTRADQDLRQARKRDRATFDIIVQKLMDLSKGYFSEDNQKKLTGAEIEVPIFEAKLTKNLRLVYQVDCVPDFESDVESQVIRVYGLYTHEQLDRRSLWECVGRQVGRRGPEYRRRCNHRQNRANKPGNIYSPSSWPPVQEQSDMSTSSAMIANVYKEDLEEMHSLLVLDKFVTFSQALLNSILVGQDVAHVFHVSPQEQKIIEHTSSCFVLGRSGTGKTTTMLFKMLGIERSWEAYRDTLPKPRQLFVTHSRVLAEKVEEYFAKLLESLATADQSSADIANIAARRRRHQEQGLVDRDEEVLHRGDLPDRYGALTDEHFPLFLTFDDVCRLLESEFRYAREAGLKKTKEEFLIEEDAEISASLLRSRQEESSLHRAQRHHDSFVSYSRFLGDYWRHFPQGLTKGLDPTLVYAEFMGVIKGSESALGLSEGYLDRNAYHELSTRTQATFATQREAVYQLFLAYLKKKRERGDWDAPDRSHTIIRELQNGFPGNQVEFLYVDEAQDNMLIDACVLRALCRNPHGMFWAGDTAQTISAGSAFRFDDLKAFLYRVEESLVGGPRSNAVRPKSFQLAVNYRSHAGIVNCAHTVIQLITQFWPNAIDGLAEEKGLIEGLKPVFFNGWNQDNMRYEQFLFGESGSHIEFGAQQCILVRDDVSRQKLRSQVGDIGLILTLYESKGLEFNDVLLYNFFEDSTCDASQWRVLLNTLPESERTNYPAPRLDESRHNGICRELKFLYVAITRARKNLWIADCSDKGETLRIIWTQRDQIQTFTPGSDVPRLAMSSAPEEWARTARSLFDNRRYEQAMHCYERAGLFREKQVAHAYSLRERAQVSSTIVRGSVSSQPAAYILAAEEFLRCANEAVTEKLAYCRIAAQCFADATEYRRAAEAYLLCVDASATEKERLEYYRIAAKCYIDGGDHVKAAEVFCTASEYDDAAQQYRIAGMFDDAVRIIKTHEKQMDGKVVAGIVRICRLVFLRENNIKKARELFDSDEEAIEYMDDYGFNVARASILEELCNYEAAAELLFEEGNTFEAVRLLSLESTNALSAQRAIQIVLAGLWSVLSIGVEPTEAFIQSHPTLPTLFRLAEGLRSTPSANTGDSCLDEIAMFRAIASRDISQLTALSQVFVSGPRQNQFAALLCLDHVFSASLDLESSDLLKVVEKLRSYLLYARLLQSFAFNRFPSHDVKLRQLLNVQPFTEDIFLIPKDASMLTAADGRWIRTLRSTEGGYLVPRWDLDGLMKAFLQKRLLSKVVGENAVCWNLSSLSPCLVYAVYQDCRRENCPQYHGTIRYYDAISYNARVRIHLLQILIYHTVGFLEDFGSCIHQKRLWLARLTKTILPEHDRLGALHALSPVYVPELTAGLRVVALWIRDVLAALEPDRAKEHFLTDLVQSVHLALIIHHHTIPTSLQSVRCISTFRPPDLLRNDQAYIVHDALSLMRTFEIPSLNRGFLFIKHVVENHVPIDIVVLCDVLDLLSGCLIVATRTRGPSGLTNITLPKSWILRLCPRLHALSYMDIRLSRIYIHIVAELAERVYMGYESVHAAHLLFGGSNFSKNIPFAVRRIYLIRIFNNLCLWGYNVPAMSLREEILKTITYLRRRDAARTFPRDLNQYVHANHWDDLAKLVRHSLSNSQSDELVQLIRGPAAAPSTSSHIQVIKRVVYEKLEDIPRLLDANGLRLFDLLLPSIDVPVSTPAGGPPVVTKAETHALPATNENGASDSTQPSEVGDVEGKADEDVAPAEAIPDIDDITRAIDSDGPIAISSDITDDKLKVAERLAAAHRCRVHRRSAKKNPTSEIMRRMFPAYLAEAEARGWPQTSAYRLVFLGPLPHLYAVVESMKNYLYEAKNGAKKRLNFVQHLDLEKADSSLTAITRRFKEALRMHQALAPTSELHNACSKDCLRACALQVVALVESLPAGPTLEWKANMDIAIKGIVTIAHAQKQKPDLNVVDIDIDNIDSL